MPTLLAERIAGGDVARFQAAAKPLRSLGGGPVGECLGADVSSGHALTAVVAHRGGGIHASSNVGLIDDVALFGRVAPYTRETVGLQLQLDGKRVGGGWF